MPLLILGILFLFVMPWLGVLFLGFALLLFILIPLGFAAKSLVWLFIGPKELFKVMSNKKVRKNHALEHATINVIEERYGIDMLSGISTEEGFSVNGPVSPAIALSAASEALARLKRGEKGLAIHARCGTTIVVVNTLSSLIFILALIATDSLGLWTVLLAISVSWLLGPYMSRLAQAHITTLAEVDDIVIAGAEVKPREIGVWSMRFLVPGEIFIRTRTLGEPLKVEVLD
ncbi:DUF6391 domain-containing protein [Thermovirga sp.]|uniref:DUF6391 domain-containing protein n=1 Tax=Thermovirga sp. TaxID=2699834 RepID=UPI0025FB5725|nr:DUF6391 domain-containing protein [Thermovirga sp.]MBO8153774.1 hypothetical protein [Thermovirga sp.]